MPDQTYIFMWRCARCGCHFSNIEKIEGVLKQEKKCPKCKSVNTMSLNSKEVIIHCKFYDPATEEYQIMEQESYRL